MILSDTSAARRKVSEAPPTAAYRPTTSWKYLQRRQNAHLLSSRRDNHLLLNMEKTEERAIDFRRKGTTPRPLSILDRDVELVEVYRHLGVTIDNQQHSCVQEGLQQTP